mmetsp:Transcript_62144/g.128880  ORF Transcript_62144/g.128880 Transcript_62144/m.128880 type:complete len:224 (-) Transcript_62144:5309-5980(-)
MAAGGHTPSRPRTKSSASIGRYSGNISTRLVVYCLACCSSRITPGCESPVPARVGVVPASISITTARMSTHPATLVWFLVIQTNSMLYTCSSACSRIGRMRPGHDHAAHSVCSCPRTHCSPRCTAGSRGSCDESSCEVPPLRSPSITSALSTSPCSTSISDWSWGCASPMTTSGFSVTSGCAPRDAGVPTSEAGSEGKDGVAPSIARLLLLQLSAPHTQSKVK